MKGVRALLIIVEVLLLVGALMFWILEIYHPDSPFESYAALFAMGLTAIEIYRRFPKRVNRLLDVDQKQIFLVNYLRKGSIKSGYAALCFYNVKISNTSDRSFTVKEVYLAYSYNARDYLERSVIVPTGLLAEQSVENRDYLVVNVGGKTICVMGWHNLLTSIVKYNALLPGEVLEGSALFYLNFKNGNEIALVKNLRLVISDYLNHQSVHPIKLPNNLLSLYQGAVIDPSTYPVNK